MSLSDRLQQAWWRADGKAGLSIALLDVSWVYGALIKLRRKLYISGVMHSTRLPVPVIVVGNVIAGGAGKTPIVIEIARHLQRQGWQPGIVSRGYGRSGMGVTEVLSNTPIAESGDEPALIQRALAAPVFVADERTEAALALLAKHPEVNIILSDDGLQHLALQRDVEIVVFDERGIGNGRLLPAGPLREPWPRAADFVLHRGGFEAGFQIERHLADHALRADGTRIALQELQGQELIALAGIAHPTAFFDMLRAQGLQLQDTLALPDHYDFHSCPRTFHKGQRLICTEKDAVKLHQAAWAQGLEVLAVLLQVQLPQAFTTALDERLSSLAGTPSTAGSAPPEAPIQ